MNTGTVGVNSFPKTATRQRRGCDLNPDSATEPPYLAYNVVQVARPVRALSVIPKLALHVAYHLKSQAEVDSYKNISGM